MTIAHRYTPKEQLKIHTQLADVIVVAAGKSLDAVIWWNIINRIIPSLIADMSVRTTSRENYVYVWLIFIS